MLAAAAALFASVAAREALAVARGRANELLVQVVRALAPRSPAPALLGLKLAVAALGGGAAWVALPVAPGRLGLLLVVALPLAGFWLPDALGERERRRRRHRLVTALPDAADLLAVASAAGRSPGGALAEVARSSAGPLGAELRVLAAEVDCGQPLADGLRALRERTESPQVAALCAAVERSHRLGSPLADQLRRQASALRRDQRRAIEEWAAKAAPKIQLVVALVLVPSVLLMIAAALIANADLLLAGF